MPVIEFKTNISVPQQKKRNLSAGFSEVFSQAGEQDIAKNLLVHVEDNQYICFRHTDDQPTALAVMHPGYLTPKEDYEKLTVGTFRLLKEEFPEINPKRIYITFSQIDFWGWDGMLLQPQQNSGQTRN